MPQSRGMSFVKRTLDKLAPNRDKTGGPSSGAPTSSKSGRTRNLTSASSTTLANSVYSEKLEDFGRVLADTDASQDVDKYPVLKLNDNLSVSIGDGFEPNPNSNVEETAKFEYGPVRDPKTIRLLLIFPSAGPKDMLETIMFHADLEEVPFQALSHTCRDRDRAKDRVRFVHCNGLGLAVTEGMHQALVDVRNHAEPDAFSIVWAEAVCIDQDDVRDRENHLRLVRDIFSSAHVTLAHLGGSEEQRALSFETVDKLHEACKYDEFRERLEQDEIDLSSLGHLRIEVENNDQLNEIHLDIPPENRLELTRLFSHHWWERIWNWQEVGVSRKVCIMYGGALRTWGHFANAAWCMYQLRWETSVGDDCLAPGVSRDDLKHYHILHLDEHRDGALQGSTFNLLSLLTESRHFSAAHPLDRVFALYSHIGNSRERDIVEAFFDYSLPRLDLYLNITLNCILSHRTLDVLNLAQNNLLTHDDYWPSFVPDLSIRDNRRILGAKNGRRSWEYHAAADTAPQLHILNHPGTTREGIPWFTDDVHILLKGLRIDHIAAVGTEMKGPTLGSHTFLADWVNVALMTEPGQKFYTAPEMKRARELLQNSMKNHKMYGGKNIESSGMWVSRRTSLAGSQNRRPSAGDNGGPSGTGATTVNGNTNGNTNGNGNSSNSNGNSSNANGGNADSRSYLRNAFSPQLIEALQKLDLDSEGTKDPNGGVDPLTMLPHDKSYPIWGTSVVDAFWRTLIKDKDENGREPPPEMRLTHFEPWFRAMAGSVSHMLEAMAHGQSDESGGPRPEPLFNDLVHMSCNGTRIARTNSGFMGTVPRTAKAGDLVVVLYGGQTPFVLRRDTENKATGQDGGELYRLVGDCYIHGLMHGEALNMDIDEEKFELH